jgi:hypothetical protein
MPKQTTSRRKRADAESAAPPSHSPLYRGFTKATFSLRPEQLEALRAAARQRADRAGLFRPDVSEVVREALDAWLKHGREDSGRAHDRKRHDRRRAP